MFPAMDPLLMLVPNIHVGLLVSSRVPYYLSLVSGRAGEGSSLGTQSNFPKRFHADLKSVS
jgi:hypothetical protein